MGAACRRMSGCPSVSTSSPSTMPVPRVPRLHWQGHKRHSRARLNTDVSFFSSKALVQPSWVFRSSLAAWSPPSRRLPSRALAACLPFLLGPATGALARYLKGHPVAGVAALAILVGGFKLISGGPLVCTASFKSQTSLCPTPPPPGRRRRRRRSKRIVAERSDVLSAGQNQNGDERHSVAPHSVRGQFFSL